MRRIAPLSLALVAFVACSSDSVDQSAPTTAARTPTSFAPTTTSTTATKSAPTTTGATTTAASTTTVAPTATSTSTTSTSTTSTTTTLPAYVSELYGDRANWICTRDQGDPCDSDLDITDIAADGSTSVRRFEPAQDPQVDCFYLYPTNSEDQAMNSDLVPGNEISTTRVQAARFGEVCTVFAPVYRSITLAALFGGVQGDRAAAGQIAYGDALDAWRHYLANENEGRGVILIGHSQGAGHLRRLIREEIETDDAVLERIVAAYILGSSVSVPEGEDVGGDFEHLPLCRDVDQTRCVVTYASFRATAPPPENSFFGRVRDGNGVAGCVNPASPNGGSGLLESAFSASDWTVRDPSLGIDTFFVNLPGFVTAECVEENGFSYLALTLHPDPTDLRADDLIGADLTPEWGTHLIDVQVASGTLIEMARQQIAAYLGEPG